MPVKGSGRPPVYSSSITASHYGFDSHATHKREPGMVHLNGFLGYPTSPYTVPYGVIVPKEIDNLLFQFPFPALISVSLHLEWNHAGWLWGKLPV